MKRTVRRSLIALCTMVLLIPCLLLCTGRATAVASDVVDYGFSINGEAITSAKTGGRGYSYDHATRTLTLTADFSTERSYQNLDTYLTANSVRTDYDLLRYGYVPTIDLKELESITIKLQGTVTIGRSGESRNATVAKEGGNALKSYGIYGEKCHVSILSADGGRGKLNSKTTDSAILCGQLTVSGVDMDLETYSTSAIYATKQVLIKNGSNIALNTNSLGSLYLSWDSKSNAGNTSKGIYRFDSIATLYAGYGVTEPSAYSLRIEGGSTLNVSGSFSRLIEDRTDLRKESDNATSMKEQLQLLENGAWTSLDTHDTRLYCGVYVNNGNLYIDHATMNVSMNASSALPGRFEQIRTDAELDIGLAYLYRTVGVNSKNIYLTASKVKVDMLNGDSNAICAFGHDTHAFYNMAYYRANETQSGSYNRTAAYIEVTGDTDIQARIDQRYSADAATHSRLARDNRMWLAIDFENTDMLKFKDTDHYQITYEYDAILGDLCLYRRVRSLTKNAVVYLRKSGDKYQYSDYYDFRSVTDLDSNVIDVSAKGWDGRAFEVRSGSFDIKPSRSGIKLTVNENASVRLLISGGKSSPYTGKFDLAIAGSVTIDGDGYIKDLGAASLRIDRQEGYPDNTSLDYGKLYLPGGTAETGSVDHYVLCDLSGGCYNFTNDSINTFFEYNGLVTYGKCEKYAVKLGDYAALFDYRKLITNGTCNTLGMYPIDGSLYFWHDPDRALPMGGNPIAFHHFTYADQALGFDAYVFPKKEADGSYTVYRLEPRVELRCEGAPSYYVVHGAKDLLLSSFYYVTVYDMPGANPFSTDRTVTDIPGTVSRTAPSGVEVIWGCRDKNNNPLRLNASGNRSLQLLIGTVEYEPYAHYHDYYCQLIGNGIDERYSFELRVLGFYSYRDQIAGDGETAQFSIPYQTVGNWLVDDGFVWSWEWRKNGTAEFEPIADSEAEICSFLAFYTSDKNNSNGYQFRRVATKSGIGIETVKLCSEPVTLQMGAKIVRQPEVRSLVFYTTDPRDSISFTVQYVRGEGARLETRPIAGTGITPWTFEGAELSSSTDENGVTTVTVTFKKADFCDAAGNWDPSKISADFRVVAIGGTRIVSGGAPIYFNDDASSYISITVQKTPKYQNDPTDQVALAGSDVMLETSCENLLWDDPDSSMWWEYSTDGGKTWIKITETDPSKSAYLENLKGASITLGQGTIGGGPTTIVYEYPTPYAGSKLYFKRISYAMNGALIRSVMQDGSGATYASKAATLRVIEFPQIDRQPQGQTVNLIRQTTAEIGFSYASAIPEGWTLTYRWQKRLTSSGAWTDLVSDTVYVCDGQTLRFPNLIGLEEQAYYRCLVTAANADAGTFTLITDAAELNIVYDPRFTTDAPTNSVKEFWENDPLRLDISWDMTVTSFQWQVCKDGKNWIDFTEADDGQIGDRSAWIVIEHLTTDMRGWQFRCVIVKTAGGESNTTYSGSFTVPRIRSGDCEAEAELEQAIAHGYKTIKLTGDITLTATWVVDADLTLDLNGHSLQGDGGEHPLIKLTSGATLTVIDSDPTREASSGEAVSFRGGSIRNAATVAMQLENGTAILRAGTLSQCAVGVSVEAGSRFVLNGGQITDCETAVFVLGDETEQGSFELQNGMVVGCDLAVEADGGIIRLRGGIIRGGNHRSRAVAHSGAIYTNGVIYADGGVVEGSVTAKTIKRLDPTSAASTAFLGTLSAETITAGLYYGEVTGISKDDTTVVVTFYNGERVYATLVLTKGSLPTMPTPPTDPRTLVGWYDGDQPYLFNQPLNEDLTLTAKWTVSAETFAQLQTELETAKQELNEAIDQKASTTALTDAITALNTALTNAQSALAAADTANKAELNQAITDAKTALQGAINKVADDLASAKTELTAAIESGDEALDGKITALNTALTNAQSALAAADTTNKAELNQAITDAKTALQSAINKVADDLANAKAELAARDTELAAKDAELEARYAELAGKLSELDAKSVALATKDSEQQTFIVIVCILASLSLAGSLASVAVPYLLKRKRIR